MSLVTEKEWDDFLSRNSKAHILQTSAWGGLKTAFGWQACRLVAGDAGAQILFKDLPLGLRWAYIPKGPVGQDWERLWPQVDAECQRRRAVFLKIEPDLWEGGAEPALGWLPSKGVRSSPHQIQPSRTLLVDLGASEDQILSRMKQKTRYNIRLSGRKGVLVEETDDVAGFYDLMAATGEREAFGVHSQDYYQRAYDMFSPKGHCGLFFARYQGKLLAALMAFAYGQTACYFYGASSNEHRNLMAPYAAQWAAMRWARQQGCTTYDLWGVPDEDFETLEANFTQRRDGLWGVYRFKRGFGGQLARPVGAWDRVYHPILYILYRLWVKKIQS